MLQFHTHIIRRLNIRAFNFILLVLYNVYSAVFCSIFQFLKMQFSPSVGPIACFVDPTSEETNQSDSFSIEEPKVHIDRVQVMMGGSRKDFGYSSEDVASVYAQLLM